MRTDYFDDLLPDFVNDVTAQKQEPVTLELHNNASANNGLNDVLPVLPMLPPKTGNTEIDEAIHDIPLAELRELAGDDWPELQSHPDTLEAFANAVQTRRMRESGLRPPHFTPSSRNVPPAAPYGCGKVRRTG